MEKSELLSRQVSLIDHENDLCTETNLLLKDLMSSLSMYQLDKLNGYKINDEFKIDFARNNNFDIEIDGVNDTVEFGFLSQQEQSYLIEYILINII